MVRTAVAFIEASGRFLRRLYESRDMSELRARIRGHLSRQLSGGEDTAQSWSSYHAAAVELDRISGVLGWREQEEDQCYNWRLLRETLRELQEARGCGGGDRLRAVVERAMSSPSYCGVMNEEVTVYSIRWIVNNQYV